MLFGYPIEIWIGTILAVIVRLKSSKTLNIIGALTTTIVAVGSGVLLYPTAIALFTLGTSWHVPVAILIALTAENLMKTIVDISADSELLKGIASFFVKRKYGDDDR